MKMFDTITAISASIISLIALIYSIIQGKLTQKHNRLSARPILDFSLLTSSAYNRHSLIIENNGLGPSLVRKYDFYIENMILKKFRETKEINRWEELSEYLEFPEKLDWHFLNEKTILKVGDKIELVGFGYENYNSEISSSFRQAVRHLKFDIQYTSIYEKEIYEVTFDGTKEIQKE